MEWHSTSWLRGLVRRAHRLPGSVPFAKTAQGRVPVLPKPTDRFRILIYIDYFLVLIVMQVALSLVLLLGGGLLVGTFQQLRSVDTGFVKERLLE